MLVVMARFDIPGIVRRIRRMADLSQRELAGATGLSQATIAGIETGQLVPSLLALTRILGAADCELAVLDEQGERVQPYDGDGLRDRGRRRYPAHLDVYPVGPNGQGWWGQNTVQDYVRPMPTHTFGRRGGITGRPRRGKTTGSSPTQA
jgi:transcriptional regulator with XRE-family HTH domain